MQIQLPMQMNPAVKRIIIGAGIVILAAVIILLVVSYMHRSNSRHSD